MKEVNIYEFSDLTEYLNSFIKAKQTSVKGFSIRSIAARLSGTSHSQLYQIIKGKKRFPLTMIQEMSSKVLKLNWADKRYFKALVELNHYVLDKASAQSILDLKSKLNELKPIKIKSIDFNEVTSRPLTMILFEIIGRSNINNVNQLKPDAFINCYSQIEIKQSLTYLMESGHISISSKGELKRFVDHLMAPNDVPSQHVRAYHKEVSAYVPRVLEEVSINQREFQSFAINICLDDMPKAKELIREFVHDFARQLEAPIEKLNSTYNLSLQLFPLSKV